MASFESNGICKEKLAKRVLYRTYKVLFLGFKSSDTNIVITEKPIISMAILGIHSC